MYNMPACADLLDLASKFETAATVKITPDQVRDEHDTLPIRRTQLRRSRAVPAAAS